jgi:hypothetical protein
MGVSEKCNIEMNNFNKSLDTKLLDLLELGDQEHIFLGGKCRDKWKNAYKSYTTLDLWNSPGVTSFDLSEYSPESHSVDLITNFGTSEHVEPQEGHYNCWLNMHKWLRVNGFLISEVPESGHWLGHGRFTYTHDFFKSFENIGYKVKILKNIEYEKQGNLIFCILQKTEEFNFFKEDVFHEMIIIDPVFNINTAPAANNPKNIKE